MDLTPDQITALILTAFEKGIVRGRELAAAEASAGPQVFVRPGRFVYASPEHPATPATKCTQGTCGHDYCAAARKGPCTHERTNQARDGETWGPKQCMDCGEVLR